MNKFSKRLKELMKEYKYTQKQLGKMLFLSADTISNYCNGKREPSLDNLIKFSIIFEVSTDYLLGLED